MTENHHSNLAWRVGGPQGSGVDTAARIFANACLAGRLHVFGRREYYSNIMGRHSYDDVRVADRPMSCHRSHIDFLTTFEEETLARHAVSVLQGGGLVYAVKDADVPLQDIAFLDQRVKDDLADYLAARKLPPTTTGGDLATADPLADFSKFLRLHTAEGDASEHTIRSYHTNARQFVAWCQERGINPAAATENDLFPYRKALVDAGYREGTVAVKLASVRRLCEAIRWRGLRDDNPAAGVKAPRDRTSREERTRFLPLDGPKQLIDALDSMLWPLLPSVTG